METPIFRLAEVTRAEFLRPGEAEANGRRIMDCVHALRGVRNPEAVPKLIALAKHVHDLHHQSSKSECPCPICTAFREIQMETPSE